MVKLLAELKDWQEQMKQNIPNCKNGLDDLTLGVPALNINAI